VHVPDGFLDAPTSLATAGVAVVGVGLALRGARKELDERTAPLAGLVAAFIFATQMVNFPVGAGTSGHLLGGALAAALVGPWTGVLCVSVVLLVQGLLFADGGLTALGTNITLMALVGVGSAWLVLVAIRKVLPELSLGLWCWPVRSLHWSRSRWPPPSSPCSSRSVRSGRCAPR
jgi:cobalt/nickel transport system permease protein